MDTKKNNIDGCLEKVPSHTSRHKCPNCVKTFVNPTGLQRHINKCTIINEANNEHPSIKEQTLENSTIKEYSDDTLQRILKGIEQLSEIQKSCCDILDKNQQTCNDMINKIASDAKNIPSLEKQVTFLEAMVMFMDLKTQYLEEENKMLKVKNNESQTH